MLLARPISESSRAGRSAALSLSKGRSAVNRIRGVVTDVIFQQDKYKVTFDNALYVYLKEAPKISQKISVRVKVECLA